MYALPQHQHWLNTTVFLQYKNCFLITPLKLGQILAILGDYGVEMMP
jgi:hypothetical protein